MRRTLALVLLAASAAVAADDPPEMIDGVARIAGTDRPAARVTLHVGRPGEPDLAVVTDEGGRFAALAPDNVLAFRRDGQQGPQFEAEAEAPGRWTWEPADTFPFPNSNDAARKQIGEALRRPAPTTWRGGGAAATLRLECPPFGEVEVLVRGPDGAAVADRPVQVVPVWMPGEMRGFAEAVFRGRTDASGRFRMRWFDGMRRLRVIVPGVGFGSTPPFEVTPGAVTRLETPPLARFGAIAGRLDPALAKPGTQVRLDEQPIPPASCDAEGRFELRDVPPGEHTLRVSRDGRSVPHRQAAARVAPGATVAGVAIEAPEPAPPGAAPKPRLIGGPPRNGPDGKPEEVTWIEGTTRDAAGRPVAKAEVFVRTGYHGGIRMYEEVRKTTSDDRGHYEIRGPVRNFVEPLIVVAHVEGRPPAVATAPGRSARNDRAAALDLTFADRGGSARVAVLKEGRPLAGAGVGLAFEGAAFALSDLSYVGAARGPERAELDAIVSPTAQTGADGVAHFAGLLPGLYDVLAIDSPEPGGVRAMAWTRQGGMAYGRARGLGVAAGREASTALAVAPEDGAVRFLVLRPDGRPVTGQSVSFQFGPAGNVRSGGMLRLDDKGVGEHAFYGPGVWSVVIRFRDTELKSFPAYEEPFYEAEAMVPVSSALRLDEPIRMVGIRRERGSLRVRLLDPDGRPARGAIEVAAFMGRADFAASADARGEVRFEAMPSKAYPLRAFLEGPPPVAMTGPWPDDAALRGPYAIVPAAEGTVTAGREAVVEMRAKAVGYVRGTLHPAPGRKPSDYVVATDHDHRLLRQDSRVDPDTGQFLVGPVFAGPARLRVLLKRTAAAYPEAGSKAIEVLAGAVTHADVTADDAKAPGHPGGRQAMLGMGGLSVLETDPEKTPVTVVQAGGTSPAFAAQALLFVPEYTPPISSAIAGADGRLSWRGLWVTGDPADRGKEGNVDRPTMVISLPGSAGATILPLEPGRPTRAELPAPVAAEGRVTVGGRAIAGGGAGVRVVAAHKGRGAARRRPGRRGDDDARRSLHPARSDARPLPRPGGARRHLGLARRRPHRRPGPGPAPAGARYPRARRDRDPRGRRHRRPPARRRLPDPGPARRPPRLALADDVPH